MVTKDEYAELKTMITGNKNILVAILNRFDTINERLIEVLEDNEQQWQIIQSIVEKFKASEQKSAEKKDVDFEQVAKPLVEKKSDGKKEEKSKPSLEHEVEFEERTYKRFIPCKYKCGFWTAWPTDYKKSDNRKLHINPNTKEVIGLDCPEFS